MPNQRPWYVQPCNAIGHIKGPVPLVDKSRTSCPRGRVGFRCRQGVTPPLTLSLRHKALGCIPHDRLSASFYRHTTRKAVWILVHVTCKDRSALPPFPSNYVSIHTTKLQLRPRPLVIVASTEPKTLKVSLSIFMSSVSP